MNTVAEVKLWGRTIGAIALNDDSDIASFEYDRAFAQSDIQIAPLTMPLSNRVYRFPELARNTFYGLPGLLADSLPDKFGNALINAWLATQGRRADSFNAIERLCYTGDRGMGALEYAPATGPTANSVQQLQVDQLVQLASDILSQRDTLHAELNEQHSSAALKHIFQVGTSAGGARAKAVIAWNPATNEVRSGQIEAGNGFQHWLLKFDGVSNNKDKELEDPKGYGLIEYAYYKMALDAGITMNECRLLTEHNRHHFMTKRFDRLDNGAKLHMQSLCALAHYDFNMAGAYSYEQAFMVMRQLRLPMQDIEQLFRRMTFNIIARNQDDHVKNIAFLMDKQGTWRLSPAFDITYAYQPNGLWTSQHQMMLNGKRDGFTFEDFKSCAKTVGLKKGRAESIIKEVIEVVKHWTDYADEVGVNKQQRDIINSTLRLSLEN
ncbi:MAG: type II toxin-antitoxin system HipA family toxin [Gammaproteobacteria bacterium]|nr:type II toxin-antitoxin system HipA family toxin [Gammaproteobacteria bacterium]